MAAARNVGPLEELTEKYPGRLVPLSLDVTDRRAVFDGVERAAAAGSADSTLSSTTQAECSTAWWRRATEEQIRAIWM